MLVSPFSVDAGFSEVTEEKSEEFASPFSVDTGLPEETEAGSEEAEGRERLTLSGAFPQAVRHANNPQTEIIGIIRLIERIKFPPHYKVAAK